MNDQALHQLIERNAQLTAENSELMGILLSVLNSAPKEKPTFLNSLRHALKFWAVGQSLRIRLEWMSK